MNGLASFTAERKTKEIGTRKVLGASSSGVIVLPTFRVATANPSAALHYE